MTPALSATLLRTQSDARLAKLTREGHERAFEAIVERYRRALHRYLRRMLPESRSEDALQQTFIKAWSALGQGSVDVADLKPWLYRIAHNTALDALRKAGYDYDELHESLRSPDAPDGDLERRTVMRETLAGVAALPERQREALLRVAVEGQSRAQVAHDLGLTDGAVRQLVHRARMTLRAAATAITPLPLAAWAAAAREHNGPIAQRVAELAAGGGAAGGAGLLLKGGTVIVAAGALAMGPPALKSERSGGDQASA
ncbi:MAG: sigma-70 family RNA polymerase sigma factor, partial [Actinomycetota bacterium]|nr:sigma-70 family RNA polymerase sigma factor [Actinomycetota bacterium]